MRRLIVVIGCVIGSAAMANVGVFSGPGQTPVVEKTDAVQMVEEVVVMTPRAADGPVGTNCSNQDPMDYHCTFRLRNLTDKAVKIQAGFPLDAQFLRYGEKQTTEELVKRFDFSVEVRGQAEECRRNLRQLQACGEQFKMMGYGLPSDLNQFVEKEFLKSLPKCPNGGRYAVSEDDKGVVRATCSSGLKGHATYK